MATHHLDPAPETTHWGYLDAALPPRLTIASGDTLIVGTVSGAPEVLPGPPLTVRHELRAIHAAQTEMPPGPHILTGPVAIEGATPGDALEVRIRDVTLRDDWGFNLSKPGFGALPEDFPEPTLTHIALDAGRQVGRLPWGLELPLAPFFGVIGVAPPPDWGRCTSVVPRAFGGNIDCKELVPGSTLWLPVFVPGANLSVGDGHGCQGDGEVNLTAIETGLIGTFEIHLHKRLAFAGPRAETPTHHIALAFDVDLDVAAQNALRDMIALIVARTGLTREEAYALCSFAADLRITQLVNRAKGVHCMLRKELLGG